jgi:hypothetical protein
MNKIIYHLKINIMKVLILLLMCLTLQAQSYISSDKNYLTAFNDKTEEYDLISEYDEYNFFRINKAVTIIEHVSSEFQCSYLIKNVEKEPKVWTFNTVSNKGEKYNIVLDLENNNIRLIFYIDKVYMIQYTINKIWYD